MDINLDQFNAGLTTTIDSIATSASAFNGGSSSIASNVPSFDDHLQQAAQQSSGRNDTNSSNNAPSATTFNGNTSNADPASANNDDNTDPQSKASSNLTDRSRGDDPSSRTARPTERKSRHSKTTHHDNDRAPASTSPSHDQGSTSAASDSHDKSTADGSTTDGNKDAGQVSATPQPAQVATTVEATQATTAVTSLGTTNAQGLALQTGVKSQTPTNPGTPAAGPSAGTTANATDAAEAAATQQAAATQAAAQSANTTTDATSTTLQAATQPGLATQVAGEDAIHNVVPTEAPKGPAVTANVQPSATATTPVLPTPAVNPTTDAALPSSTSSNDHSKSDQPSNNGQDATVTFAAPTAGLSAAIAAATLGNTTVDTSSVDVTTPAVAAISKTADVKSNKGDVNAGTSQDSTSATNSTNSSTIESPRPTITLGPQSSLGTERGTSISAADQARFVQRVAKAFEAAGNHEGPLVVRLSPPELGSLKLEISVRDGALTANVQTDNSTTRNILLDNLPALRDRLEQQDIRIERFSVEVQDRSAGGQPQLPDQNSGTNDSARRYRAANTIEAGASAEPAIQSGGISLSGGGQLNVVI